jgi:hypothetical protein
LYYYCTNKQSSRECLSCVARRRAGGRQREEDERPRGASLASTSYPPCPRASSPPDKSTRARGGAPRPRTQPPSRSASLLTPIHSPPLTLAPWRLPRRPRRQQRRRTTSGAHRRGSPLPRCAACCGRAGAALGLGPRGSPRRRRGGGASGRPARRWTWTSPAQPWR